jgi:hypothetical protein
MRFSFKSKKEVVLMFSSRNTGAKRALAVTAAVAAFAPAAPAAAATRHRAGSGTPPVGGGSQIVGKGTLPPGLSGGPQIVGKGTLPPGLSGGPQRL